MQRAYTNLLRCVRAHRCQCRLKSSQTPRTVPAKTPLLKDPNTFLLLCPLTCVGLALWQVKRKEWKENLIQTIKDRYEMEPLELPQDLSNLEELELYPIKVRGHFDYTNEVYIGPRTDVPERNIGALGGRVPGVYVITPFKLADREDSILINRGWYENEYFIKDADCRKKGQVHGEQEIVGILRKDQNTSSFMWKFMRNYDKPDKKAGCDVYGVRKLDLLAERCGTLPVYMDAKMERKSPDEPRPIKIGVELRNEHLTYILTWTGLAFCTFYLWFGKVKAPLKPSAVDAFMRK